MVSTLRGYFGNEMPSIPATAPASPRKNSSTAAISQALQGQAIAGQLVAGGVPDRIGRRRPDLLQRAAEYLSFVWCQAVVVV